MESTVKLMLVICPLLAGKHEFPYGTMVQRDEIDSILDVDLW